MAEADDPKAIKEYRSKLRSKVTTAANTLTRKLQTTSNLDEIESDHQALHAVYDEFTVCQLSYEELIASDERYNSYKTVGGLSLEQYSEAVNEVYNKAVKTYNTRKDNVTNSVLGNEASTILAKAKTILIDLDAIVRNKDEVSVDNVVIARAVLDEAKVTLDKVRNFSIRITPIEHFSELLKEINACVSDLDVLSYKVRQLPYMNVSPALSAADKFSIATNPANSNGISPSSVSEANRVAARPSVAPSGVESQSENVTRVQVVDNSIHSIDSHDNANIPQSPSARSVSVTSAYSTPVQSNITSTHVSRNILASNSSNKAQVGLPINANQSNAMQTQATQADNGQLQTQTEQQYYNNYPKFKRTPPPTFDGERSEWPEFRAIWRRHGQREYPNDEERAYALKRSLKGRALEHVKAIFVTQPNAYERIWARLDNIYSDMSYNVQSAFTKLSKLKSVAENDMNSMVTFVNEVEMCYSSLGEIGQLEAITVNQIDTLCDLLPVGVRKQWLRIYRQLPQNSRIHPFHAFMEYLEEERDDSLRLAEKTVSKKQEKENNSKQSEKKAHKSLHAQSDAQTTTTESSGPIKCAVHTQAQVTHTTKNAESFVNYL